MYSEAWVLRIKSQQDPQTRQRQGLLDRRQSREAPQKRAVLPAWPGNAALDAWAQQQAWVRPACAHTWEPSGPGWTCPSCGLFRAWSVAAVLARVEQTGRVGPTSRYAPGAAPRGDPVSLPRNTTSIAHVPP